MRQKLIIKTGHVYPALQPRLGDFDDWIRRELGDEAGEWRVVDVLGGETLPAVEQVAAAVITGSAAMVSARAAWSERTADWLRHAHAREVPLLGICFGHQLLASALGGEVDYHPQGPEAGTVQVHMAPEAQQDVLLSVLPPVFAANVIHWQSVRRLPPGAVCLAGNEFEATHAFRHGSAWGVQFHPEFNSEAMHCYLGLLGDALAEAGLSATALQQTVVATPQAATVLRRFASLLPASAQARAGRVQCAADDLLATSCSTGSV